MNKVKRGRLVHIVTCPQLLSKSTGSWQPLFPSHSHPDCVVSPLWIGLTIPSCPLGPSSALGLSFVLEGPHVAFQVILCSGGSVWLSSGKSGDPKFSSAPICFTPVSGYYIFPLSLWMHQLLEVPVSLCLIALILSRPPSMGVDSSSPLPWIRTAQRQSWLSSIPAAYKAILHGTSRWILLYVTSKWSHVTPPHLIITLS